MIDKVLSFAETAEEYSILQRKVLAPRAGLKVSLLSGFASAPALLSFNVPEGSTLVVIAVAGAGLHHSSHPGGIAIQTPMSATILGGPDQYHSAFARGQHKWIEILFEDESLAVLSNWRKTNRILGSRGTIPTVRLDPEAGFVTPLAQGLWKGLTSGETELEGQVVATVAGIFDLASASYRGAMLAAMPESAPESLISLMRAVKAEPCKAWSLKDAAYMAGYSAFHLSRTFRALMDYGFPEFVDRCRTERALDFIVGTEKSLDDISAECGFGSTQALRGACREYIGLLPSEIRSLLLVH